MRRAQAIIVILALAALPLVLLPQTNSSSGCNGMCCIRHSMHGISHAKSTPVEMSCHHGALGHLFQCGMHSTQHQATATLAPLPPTMLSATVRVPAPSLTRAPHARSTEQIFPGFIPIPFEPPRA